MRALNDVQATYRKFAVYAAGTSACFEQWALGVADDLEVQHWLAALPEPKRQPNLVFAAARRHGVDAPAPYEALRDDGRIRDTILTRATQTNEAGRLATLVPAFAHLAAGRPLGCSRRAPARDCACSPTAGTPRRARSPAPLRDRR